MTEILFLSWSWKSGLPAQDFVEAINSFEGGPIYATAVADGTSDYMLALSRAPISAEQAYAAWITPEGS